MRKRNSQKQRWKSPDSTCPLKSGSSQTCGKRQIFMLLIVALISRPAQSCTWYSTGEISDKTYTSHQSSSLSINPPDYASSGYYSWCYTSATLCYTDTTTNGNGCVDITSNYNSYFPWITGFDTTYGTMTIQRSDLRYLVTDQTVNFQIHMQAWEGARSIYFYDACCCDTSYWSYFTWTPNSDGSQTAVNIYNWNSWWNDRVASIWIPTGYTVRMWQHSWNGAQETYTGSDNCISLLTYYDQTTTMDLWGPVVGSGNIMASKTWNFDVTVRNRCMDNSLTASHNPSDINYLIDDDGSTAGQTQYATVYGSIDKAYCPLTRVMQIWDDTAGDWVAFSSGTYSWGSYIDYGSYHNYMQFTVDTESGTTLDSASVENTIYHLRVKTHDQYSTVTNNAVYQSFDVIFNYECQDDYFSLSGISEQSFQLGSGDRTIYLGWSQAKTHCAKTVSHYYYNNSTSAWESFSGANFRRGEGNNYITIGVSSGSYSSYRPEVYYQIKVVWTSTYSEQTSGTVEEIFKIRFYDQCFSNALSLSSQLSDTVYQVSSSYATYTPNVATSISTGTCPLTATCTIYTESKREWESCSVSPYNEFYSSFNSGTGAYQIRYTVSNYQSDYSSPYPDVTHLVKIRLEDPRSVATESNWVEETFQLTIRLQCGLDTIVQSTSDTNIGDTTLYINSAQVYKKIDVTQSDTSCPLTYALYLFNESTEAWDTYSSGSHYWVHSFNTGNGDLWLKADNNSNFSGLKPIYSLQTKLTVTSYYSAEAGNMAEDTFTLTIRDLCYDNVLSVASNPTNINYLIEADGATAQTYTIAGVSDNQGESRCPLTRTVQIWSDSVGDFITFNQGTYNWASISDQSSSYSRIVFYVDTEDYNALDNSDIDQSLFHIRVVTQDPYSIQATNPTYQTFDVSFNYQCQDDYFSLSGVSLQSFYLGQGNMNIGLGMSHYRTNCAYTYNQYVWNNSTSAWDAITTANFYRSKSDNQLTIGVSSGYFGSYRPEKYYKIKVTWQSTNSEQTNGYMEEEFWIRIYDPCFTNTLSLNSQLADVVYSVSNNYATYTPSISTGVSTGTCPITATCSIYTESKRVWESCSAAPYNEFYASFNAATGAYQIRYTVSNYQSDYSAPYPDVTHLVKIRLEDPLSVSDSNWVEDSFELTIRFACMLDTVEQTTSDTNIGHTQLIIDHSSSTYKKIDFTQSDTSCPLTYGLYFWNTDTEVWDTYSSSTHTFVQSFSTSNGNLYFLATDESTYDMEPWYNITAKVTVISDYSVQSKNQAEDTFRVSIVEKCRMTSLYSAMSLGSGGYGTLESQPYTIDMWQLLTVPMTTTTYTSPYTSPLTYSRCTIAHTLHYNDSLKSAVPTAKYLFNSYTAATQLQIQWDTGTMQDYFIVRVQVIYTRTNEVILTDEAPLYVTVSNPCLQPGGGAITAATITDINYWIKASTSSTTVSYFADSPSTRDAGRTYLYTNGNDLCGAKSYEIVMADKTISNQNTVYLNLHHTGSYYQIQVYTADPVYFTNSQVQYYLKVTLDTYVQEYPDEATHYQSFLLDMMNCQVTSFNKDADLVEEYILYTPVEKYPYTAWTDNASPSYIPPYQSNCGYTLNFSVKWRNFYDTELAVPTFIEWKDDLPAFWVQSDDTTAVQYDRIVYVIELTGSTDITDQSPIYTEVWTLTLTVVNTCPIDTLTLISSTFTDYTYYIGENTETPGFIYNSLVPMTHTSFTANWATSIPYCPLGFEILRDYSDTGPTAPSSYEAFKQGEAAVLTLINEMVITKPTDTWEEQFPTSPYYQDPQVTLIIQTSDYTLLQDANGNYQDEVVWYLAVNRISSESNVDNKAARVYFQLTLADVCHDLPLTPSEPAATTIQVYLFDILSIAHAGWQITNGYGWPSVTTYCSGGFTMFMKYQQTTQGVTPGDTISNIDALFGTPVDGTFANILLQERDWVGKWNYDTLGIHEFKIRTYIGVGGGARQGMYTTNYVESTNTIVLEVRDPCNEAILTIPTLHKSDSGSQNLLEAREMGGRVVLQYEMPWSDASDIYGPNLGLDKYQLCGPLNHHITMENGSVLIGLQSSDSNYKVAPWLEFVYLPDGDPSSGSTYPPVYQLRVNSTDIQDQGLHELTLHFGFDQYPESTVKSEEWVIDVQIEYCLVQSWKAPADFETILTIGQKPIQVKYVFQQYPCSYGATYSARLLEISGEPQADQSLPAFVQMDAKSGVMLVYTSNYDNLGWYLLEITATLDVIENLGEADEVYGDPSNAFLNTFLYDMESIDKDKLYWRDNPPDNFIYQAKFNMILGVIRVNETSITDENTRPFVFPPPDREFKVIAGRAWTHEFGTVMDWEGDEVQVDLELRNAAQFVSFDKEAMTLSIEEGATNDQTQPVFDIRLTLTDNNPTDPLKQVYDIVLVIVKDWRDPIVEIIEQARKEEVIHTYGQDRVYDLSQTSIEEVTESSKSGSSALKSVPNYQLGIDTTGLSSLEQAEDQGEDEADETKPDPQIESFSNDGVAKLRFNTKMKVPDLSQIAESKVALRMTKAIKTEVETKQFLTDDGLANFEIRNAVEVSMAPSELAEDPLDIEFSWEITKFTESEAHIQLYFDFPESVSTGSSDPDNVQITFWAGDLFQAENGKQVRPGMTITAPVTRQVSVDDAVKYRQYGRIAGFSCLGFFTLGLLYAISVDADTLPIWACYDTMVLVSHFPMLNIAMPGRSAVLLTEIAQIFRFNFIPVNEWLQQTLDLTFEDDQPLSNLFSQNGYTSSMLIINLGTVLVLFTLIVLAQLCAKFINCSYATLPRQPRPNGRQIVARSFTLSQKVMNCFLRFLLMLSLELFICLLINFKVDLSGAFAKISAIVSIFFLALLSLLTVMITVMLVIDKSNADDVEWPLASLNTLYLNMSPARRKAANLLLLTYVLRRALFASCIVMMQEYPTLQLMLLLASSTASLCILVSGRPYINRISMFTAVAQELLFSYMCIFCLIFTAEFSHRFVRVAADLGNAICVMMASVGALGFCLLTYSIIWQIVYNRRMRDEIVKRHELLKGLRYMQRQESVREQLKLATVNEDDESGDDDDDNALQLARRPGRDQVGHSGKEPKQEEAAAIATRRTPGLLRARRCNEKVLDELEEAAVTAGLETTPQTGGRVQITTSSQSQKYSKKQQQVSSDPQDHFAALKEFDRLAEIDKLDISLDEEYKLPLDGDGLPAQEQHSDINIRPEANDQVGTYSEFMQTWKKKLMTDQQTEKNRGKGTYDDGDDEQDILNKTSFSHLSRKSALTAVDESPFRNISSQQTLQLLRGEKPVEAAAALAGEDAEAIRESVDGEEEEEVSDGQHHVVLSKVERRRLNQLNNKRANGEQQLASVTTAKLIAEDQQQQQRQQLEISDDEDNDELFDRLIAENAPQEDVEYQKNIEDEAGQGDDLDDALAALDVEGDIDALFAEKEMDGPRDDDDAEGNEKQRDVVDEFDLI